MANDFDVRQYRSALGKFATGVTIVTVATEDGNKTGVTVNSFNSLSLEPPLILWCLRQGASSYRYFEESNFFCINVLALEQEWLSNRFASSIYADRFAGVSYDIAGSGTPIIADTSAHLLCKKTKVYHEGDHYIFLGEVIEFHSSARQALLFYEGSYTSSNGKYSSSKSLEGESEFYLGFEFA